MYFASFFPEFSIDVKTKPETLQDMKDQPLRAIQKAKTQDVTVEEVSECSGEKRQSIVDGVLIPPPAVLAAVPELPNSPSEYGAASNYPD